MNKEVEIFTDGACSGNPGPGGWGVLLLAKDGDIKIEGGRFPSSALKLFREHGVAQPHKADSKAPKTQTQRRYQSGIHRNQQYHGQFDYGKTVSTQPCIKCGKPVEIAGSSVWWGKGCFSVLDGCTDDFPAILRSYNITARQ